MKPKIKAIIFDADNTLYTIDNTRAYQDMYHYLAKRVGREEESLRREHKELIDEIRKDLDPKKRDYSHTLRTLLSNYTPDTKKMIEEAMRIFWDRIADDLEEKETSIITIIELNDMKKDEKQRYKLAIASDEFRPNLEKKLKKIFGPWTKAFREIITPEDTNTMKPSEEYYRIALERLKTKPEETIMVGDSWYRDLEPAKRLGIRTVLIESEDKEENSNPKAKDKSKAYKNTPKGISPDFRITKLIEIKKIIEKCES